MSEGVASSLPADLGAAPFTREVILSGVRCMVNEHLQLPSRPRPNRRRVVGRARIITHPEHQTRADRPGATAGDSEYACCLSKSSSEKRLVFISIIQRISDPWLIKRSSRALPCAVPIGYLNLAFYFNCFGSAERRIRQA